MNIHVTSLALKPLENEELIRGGALSGLIRLKNYGHEILFDELSDNQLKQLLDQEDLVTVEEEEQKADCTISAKDDKLILEINNESFTHDSWKKLTDHLTYPTSVIEHQRKTSETDIYVHLNLFGEGKSDIKTGLGFFDHMLDQIAKHALLDLTLKCDGDLHIDEHHTIEDVAIALGEALHKAIGNKKGLERFGFMLPMDETKAEVALDLSGRPFLVFKARLTREYVGDFPTEMAEHFFYSLAMNLKATMHIQVTGKNDHHKIEAAFKGFARTLRQALIRLERSQHIIPSSKGSL
jgi:imidazoleglycerol phosphate dehydratase HisB